MFRWWSKASFFFWQLDLTACKNGNSDIKTTDRVVFKNKFSPLGFFNLFSDKKLLKAKKG
jgi:hypothetical protein